MQATARNRYSLLIAILFHGGLFVLFLYFGFRVQLPLPAEQGIQVNFGTTENGSGLEEPNQQSEQLSTPEQNNEEANLTQNFEEAISIKKQNEIKKQQQVTNNQTQTQTEQQQVNQNALFPSDNNNGSNSEGETNGKGNQGDPNGDPNANSHVGNPEGGGDTYKLGDRKIKGSLPKPNYPGNEQGKVVVEISVDRNGVVTSATAGIKGSTLLSKKYLDAAYAAALRAKFDSNPDAAPIQKGTITYKFMFQ